MTFTVESKSQLAKLLAVENLTIEHQNISTARFDPQNRVLYCPVWADMSGALYDLLLGHEVGHALETPAEGWHDAVSPKSSKFQGKNFKHFLNVVEDARIEKKIKRRYPGIRPSFVSGYKELMDRDFFGIKGRDLNSMAFINRLNIYTKSSAIAQIDFSDEEQKLVNAVMSCESWEDVLDATQKIYAYSKDEQYDMLDIPEMGSSSQDDDGDFDGESSPVDPENSDETGEDGEQTEETTDSAAESDESSEESDEEPDDESDGSAIDHDKESQISKDEFEPTCETDEAFRQNESSLLDEKCKPYVYATLPTVCLDRVLTPANRVHDLLDEKWFGSLNYRRNENMEKALELVKKFKTNNERYVSLLAKEFEMKKAAKAYSKSKLSDTGDIDLNKLYKYQVEDNIFRKMMRTPKGKSHGLVLLLDRSGSMAQNMAGSIEQILVLVMFCRKVNIPFVVYGFGDSETGRKMDFPDETFNQTFSQKNHELHLSPVYLREYINSRMKTADFNRCFRNLVCLRTSYISSENFFKPKSESLSNTPLIQAIVALEPLTKDFRKVNNLDLVNLVVVHDGDADDCYRINVTEFVDGIPVDYKKTVRSYTENLYLKDHNSKLQMKVEYLPHHHWSYDDGLRKTIFNWYQQKTGAKIFGFFVSGTPHQQFEALFNQYFDKEGSSVSKICGVPNARRYNVSVIKENPTIQKIIKQLKEQKFVISHKPGYETFFIMPGGSDLNIQNDELVVQGVVTANKLKNAFMKMNKKKVVSRVMVARFIEGIAA